MIQTELCLFQSYYLWKSNTNEQVAKEYCISENNRQHAILFYFYSKKIRKAFDENYPWPLSKILYLGEKSYFKSRMKARGIWQLDLTKVIITRLTVLIGMLNRKSYFCKIKIQDNRAL